ncbi:uncharacterized protein LOC115680121 isoform X1 [Syzygium oleosum]|uniref:uncharacterized protein LOC115680121 isoform X1 n=1 Tax=Syzygium oleosum TaxID=219896 RepID=UPI0024BA8307|nr:uncharacterized protein LOC115680121 isoform X1 [Syzygium oleosum]
MACPSGSIRYNNTLCACLPGRLLNATADACALFTVNTTISVDSGVDYYAVSFPETIFSFDSIKKFTQSQAVFLEATAILLLSWLAFCIFLRFMKVGDGRNAWFQMRWWISRLDVCFATRHWLEDRRVVKKRKTELGGTLSIASWILFTGLFAALLYQIIWKRTIEIHNVKATNGPDLAAFNNDMEFIITTVSSMSCSNLRSMGTLVMGSPGLVDYRVAPLSSFANFSCQNTSEGPTVTLRCSNCQLSQDNYYFSWQFVDLPNNPATAVGFRFNLTSKAHGDKKHLSFVSGTLRNGSTVDDRPVTFRGNDTNLLKFNLFPRIYHNLHNLRLIQPLFHEFLPGSVFQDASQLQASLESSNGIINTTLYVNFLSAYIVEIDNQSIMGPISFLADLGGLYCISIGIFYYFLVQCEFRVKRLRNEDAVLRQIRHRLKAQQRWDKLRKYVMYTWDCKALEENYTNSTTEPHLSNCMMHSVRRSGSRHTSRSSRKQSDREETINMSKRLSLPSKKNAAPEFTQLQEVSIHLAGAGIQDRMSESRCDTPRKHELCSAADKKQQSIELQEKSTSSASVLSLTDDQLIPPLPALELKAGSGMDMTDVQKNIMLLYEYNAMLREKLVATHSMLRDLATEPSSAMSRDER